MRKGLAVLILLLIVGLRLVALRSDPYPRLDWSAGLLTDEGFYIHNARNVALFGRARTDEFNNMLLSPLLHFAQTAVFGIFGAGAQQARLISVISSLLTLALFWAALRRVFDNRIAWTATLFLGLDHTNLLYNRMALMDTPAALGATMAFYAFVRGIEAGRTSGTGCIEERTPPSGAARERVWFALCGLLLGVTVVSRTLCLYLLPVPFLASGIRRQRMGWLLLSILLVFALYAMLWYAPHRAEIDAMNRYYRTEQIQPKSPAHLRQNLYHAALGDFRGFSPYLFRHTPVVFALALIGIVGAFGVGKEACPESEGGKGREEPSSSHPPATSPAQSARRYLIAWLLLGWGMLAVIGYSPSRYYVTTYPALMAVAALALWQLPKLLKALGEADWRVRLLRGGLAWFLIYHAVQTFVHRGGVLPPLPTHLLVYGLPTAVAVGVGRWAPASGVRKESIPPTPNAQRLTSVALLLWLAANAYWLGDWALHLNYTQYETSRWLAQNLPAGSVLLGDVAPGVSMDNPFVAVNVIPGLCNGEKPVERFAGSPRFLVILDGRWKERYWLENYPELVQPERRLKLFRVLRWDVGVYAVDTPSERVIYIH